MSAARSGLAWPPPPPQLARFPASAAPAQLHRLSERPAPWWFASRPDADIPGGGRFDLPAPSGTCYLAATLEGALLEKTLRRPKRVVALNRLVELFHARITVTRSLLLADLAHEHAAGFGVNAEIHTTLDYTKPRAWALTLRRAHHKGLRYLLRSDPASRLVGVALFGRAGLHRRALPGMKTQLSRLDLDTAAGILARRGVQVAPIPADVPTVDPRL